ncbi:MAG: ECF transporter S component [Lachnospiraceae bacterium]|nr:ECF transporter S component [Lachnospiraceae bacterium]
MKKQEQNNTRKKNPALLIVGALIIIVSLVFAVYNHNNSYARSVAIGKELKEVKAQITAVKEGTAVGDLDALNALSAALSNDKLANERPYSYSLAALFLGILLAVKGIYNTVVGTAPSQKADVKKLAQAGLLAALCYIGFAFFKIDIPVGTEKTAFHFGNVFCVLAALLLGGYWGGLAGAIGMTIGDLTTSYVTSAPKTFLLKLLIGLIVGLVAHKIFKVSRSHSTSYVTKVTILASACGMGFNIIADPLVGYFYKTYLLGVPQDLAANLAKINLLTTSVNAVTAVICATVFYLALRPALKKAGLFVQVTPEETADASKESK